MAHPLYYGLRDMQNAMTLRRHGIDAGMVAIAALSDCHFVPWAYGGGDYHFILELFDERAAILDIEKEWRKAMASHFLRFRRQPS